MLSLSLAAALFWSLLRFLCPSGRHGRAAAAARAHPRTWEKNKSNSLRVVFPFELFAPYMRLTIASLSLRD